MNKVAVDFADKNIGSFFIYTYEAHPVHNYPHLTSLEQKFQHAAAFRDVYGATRQILVDSLDGACHRYFGSMPNMTWIINKAGMAIYKSDWSDAHSVRNALEYFVNIPDRRKAGERLVPFRVERLDYRNQERDLFYAALERNGKKALEEFKKAFKNG
jgi:hypothetical protein